MEENTNIHDVSTYYPYEAARLDRVITRIPITAAMTEFWEELCNSVGVDRDNKQTFVIEGTTGIMAVCFWDFSVTFALHATPRAGRQYKEFTLDRGWITVNA